MFCLPPQKHKNTDKQHRNVFGLHSLTICSLVLEAFLVEPQILIVQFMMQQTPIKSMIAHNFIKQWLLLIGMSNVKPSNQMFANWDVLRGSGHPIHNSFFSHKHLKTTSSSFSFLRLTSIIIVWVIFRQRSSRASPAPLAPGLHITASILAPHSRCASILAPYSRCASRREQWLRLEQCYASLRHQLCRGHHHYSLSLFTPLSLSLSPSLYSPPSLSLSLSFVSFCCFVKDDSHDLPWYNSIS